MAGPVVVGVPEWLPEAEREALSAAARAGGREADLRPFSGRDGLRALLPDLEVLCDGGLRAGEAASAPRLRWIQVGSAGVERLPLGEFAAAGITLTNARGEHAEAMADHAFALLLAMARHVPEFVLAQRERRWAPRDCGVLAGRRMGILGFGAIGREIARRAAAFGMEVWATRRHPAPDPLAARVVGPGRADLLEVCAGCDDLVAVLPSTPETRGLFGAEAFAAMRPGARLVNLGRGDLLVREALADALRSGRLGGAACDCLPGEPLRPEDPLWEAPGLLVTPHVGGARPDGGTRFLALFRANLTRYCRGEPLANVVDLRAGY